MVENDNSDKAGQENIDDSQKCEGTCCDSAGRKYNKMKLVVFAIIVITAGIVLAHSLMKESNAANDDTQQFFATLAQGNSCEISPQINAATDAEMSIEASDKTELTLWGAQLDSLVSLNKVAANTDAVFVFLAAEGQQNEQAITREIEAAAQKIMSNGSKISAFRLKKSAPDYAQLAKQFSVPSVIAMVKGGGMSAVSGEINETKLVQAFVAASRPASGCGPAGCGPSGCAPVGPRK